VYEVPTTIKNKDLVEKRREQIVQAAIKLFVKKGFHRTTLRELSEEAGISYGNIYDYVGNKEDIFFLLHDYMSQKINVILKQYAEGSHDPREKLRLMVRYEFNTMSDWADSILLIYRETHILCKPLLKRLLAREREHVSYFERVIREGIEKGVFQDGDVRVMANLIKSMIDTWVLKRWDLREHVTQLEMERSILNLLFGGVLNPQSDAAKHAGPGNSLSGKSIFVLHAGTVLGESVSDFLVSQGANLTVFTKSANDLNGQIPDDESPNPLKLYRASECGPMTLDLWREIIHHHGTFDILIHDLGLGGLMPASPDGDAASREWSLEANLDCAQDLAPAVEQEMVKKGQGKILYLAPSGWNRSMDPLRYETVKAGLIALTRNLAGRLAASRTNVNCIVPGFVGHARAFGVAAEASNHLADCIPMGCLGEMPDILAAVHFLISDASRYITGQVLEVTGGMA